MRAQVLTATVRKSEVIAYFEGRKETEIVVDPRDVKITQCQQVERTADDNGVIPWDMGV